MITVIVDKRESPERRVEINELVCTIKDIVYKEDTLSVGDYVVTEDDRMLFAVEWKTYSDFVSSIQSAHLPSQLNDMEEFECPTYLFVTGTYKQWMAKAKKQNIHVSREQIIGFITAVAGRYKTRLIQYESEIEGYRGLVKLISLHKGGSSYEYKMPERKKYTGDIHADMLLSIPGLGSKTVKELREHYTFTQFISACKTDSLCVKVKKPVVEYVKKL